MRGVVLTVVLIVVIVEIVVEIVVVGESGRAGVKDSFGGQVTEFHDCYTSLPPSRELI